MKRYLISGVSTGIGRALAKDLVLSGNEVWGIARRKELLQKLKHELEGRGKFYFSVVDVSQEKDWEGLVTEISQKKFLPEIIVFNAAVFKPDLNGSLNRELIEKTFAINFFGVIEGLKFLQPVVKKGTQFLAISSFSALRGSSFEGIGYPASKAALSIAFESLRLKYKKNYIFKTIYFGPIAGGMSRFRKPSFLVTSENKAAQKIVELLESNKLVCYYPFFLFLVIKIMNIFPYKVYFFLLSKIEKLTQQYVN